MMQSFVVQWPLLWATMLTKDQKCEATCMLKVTNEGTTFMVNRINPYKSDVLFMGHRQTE